MASAEQPDTGCDPRASLAAVGVHVPTVLLPPSGTDFSKWACIACDQFTSEPDYWKKLDAAIGDAPSTLRLFYPEVYLPEKRDAHYIAGIEAKCKQYEGEGLFSDKFDGFVLLERSTPNIASRKGLVVALDLEKYDWKPGSKSMIRATEKTVPERLPPRIAVREKVPVELPHIVVLLDDPSRSVIEPLYEKRDTLPLAYDFDLMGEAGHLKGWRVSEKQDLAAVAGALDRVWASIQASTADPYLFGIGDGNHSLATAKACWEKLKAQGADPATCLQRYALVELENIYDEGIEFEPIHRVSFGVADAKELVLQRYKEFVEARGASFTFHEGATLSSSSTGRGLRQEVRAQGVRGVVEITEDPSFVLPVQPLQAFLDTLTHEVDYIHGERTLDKLVAESASNVAWILPGMRKDGFFGTVATLGVLPKKTFSLGHDIDKRFYVEARKIV